MSKADKLMPELRIINDKIKELTLEYTFFSKKTIAILNEPDIQDDDPRLKITYKDLCALMGKIDSLKKCYKEITQKVSLLDKHSGKLLTAILDKQTRGLAAYLKTQDTTNTKNTCEAILRYKEQKKLERTQNDQE